MFWEKETFQISIDKERINTHYVHQFLSSTYWAANIPVEVVQRSIQGSLCFGVYEGDKQIGFARVITDQATFAYLADVFIDPLYRGRGLSKWLMKIIMDYPGLQGLRRFLLATHDAHQLYAQFGFASVPPSNTWMQIHNPDIYRQQS